MNRGSRETLDALAINPDIAQVLAEDPESFAPSSHRSRVMAELRRNWGAMAGIVMLCGIILVTLAAPLIAGHDPNAIGFFLNQSPSGSHWFGTDYLGRDLLARVMYGGRISLPAGLGVVVLSVGAGVPLGLVAGYVGKTLDDVIMRFMDILLSFPGIILAIGVIGILSAGLGSAIIAIGITSIPFYARFVRGSTLSLKEQDFIVAAHVAGTRHVNIIRRHILPNVLGPLLVLAASSFGYAILLTAGLSFLGLGTQPPTSDWGVLVSQGNANMFLAASEVIFPGLAIAVTVLSVNLIADGLTDAFDVRG